MSDPDPLSGDPMVSLINDHWRPDGGCASGFLEKIRDSQRRARRDAGIALGALAAALVLFSALLRDSHTPNESPWLAGTSMAAQTSSHPGEFAQLQQMFLAEASW